MDMSRHFRTLIIITWTVLALAACSGSSFDASSSTPSPSTPLTAEEIITRMQQAPLKDATFTEQVNSQTAGSAVGIPITVVATVKGNGHLITHPKRVEVQLSGTVPESTFSAQNVIVDASGSYVQVSGDTHWSKTNSSGATVSSVGPDLVLNYTQLQGATLVGSEIINGIATWHLKGTPPINTNIVVNGGVTNITNVSSSTDVAATEDIWVRQDNYYPVKIEVQTTSNISAPSTTIHVAANEHILFTAWDTGITISTPQE
ncbi:MAG: hypothetical protein JO202_07655 [Ktedonobacteraceae bacterium]|nr:hypothetical protein [Ktedonobacteraceae bacterium]